MTAIVGGDVHWDATSHERLWLAVDCEGHPHATLAGLIERNSTGPLRLGYGGWRDLLLGCQFHNGRGELITAGGKTVKNVAGYDLTKFLVGQSGVFGKVAAVAMRAYRRPDDALAVQFAPDMAIFNRLIVSPKKPQWAILDSDALTCGYLGNQRTVDYYADQIGAWNPRQVMRHGLDGDAQLRQEKWKATGSGEFFMRASVPPMRVQEFTQRAGLKDWVADPAFGIVLARAPAHVADAAAKCGGRAWFWDQRYKLTAFSANAAEREILLRLKKAMDPGDQLARLS